MNAARARDAAVAARPSRAGGAKGAERARRLARERAALRRTPKPASTAHGNFAPHAKSFEPPGAGRGGYSTARDAANKSAFDGQSVPGFDVEGQLFVDQFREGAG